MRITYALGVLALTLTMVLPPAAAEPPSLAPSMHEELGRAMDELAGHIRGLEERWQAYSMGSEPAGERPLISIMLSHRQELGLSAAQVRELERLRAEFQREAIKRDADQRVAELDLAALLQADPVDLAKVEAKVHEIERLRAEMRLARIRTIEQGKAQLTQDQRGKLAGLLAAPWPPRPKAGPRPWGRTPILPQKFGIKTSG